MFKFDNGGYLVETVDDLPYIPPHAQLFADFETSSGDPSEMSTHPWHHCHPLGLALTYDACPDAWYIPMGHYWGGNLPVEKVADWWFDVLSRCEIGPEHPDWDPSEHGLAAAIPFKEELRCCPNLEDDEYDWADSLYPAWVNSNPKYDAHVSRRCMGVEFNGRLIDTITQARLIHSDRYQYRQSALVEDWLGDEEYIKYERNLKPYLKGNKDYGNVPRDILGEYACHDVLKARLIWWYEQIHMPRVSQDLAGIEIDVTRVLYEAERRGTMTDIATLEKLRWGIQVKLVDIANELCELVGYMFRPDINSDCYSVLCVTYGLPVLHYTFDKKKGVFTDNPSFSKAALKDYLRLENAPQKVVKLMLEYRTWATRLKLFVKPFLELHSNGELHAQYRQTVVTGRMACAGPNKQQQDKFSKRFIIPRTGYGFLSIDASQIEFRLIVHYIEDAACIAAYQQDPDIDFHQWVADQCQIPRAPAKNINFMLGYGGGKEKTVQMLRGNMELMERLQAECVDDAEFARRRHQRGVEVFNEYHDRLPGLKSTSRRATAQCHARGWVRNLYGRIRRLPAKAAHKSFNNLCQSSAADLMKERLVAVWRALQGTDIHIVDVVHDEILFECPLEYLKEESVREPLVTSIIHLLESPAPRQKLRVPIRWAYGWSGSNWFEAADQSQVVQIRPEWTQEPRAYIPEP